MTDDPFQDGGDSLPGIKFSDVGDTVTGQIIAMRQVEDRDLDGVVRTWTNGDTRMVWVFDLDTTGTGEADSSLWVRGNMYTVIREALKAGGVPTCGAKIRLTHHALGKPPQRGYSAPKLFECVAKVGPALKAPADAFSGAGRMADDEEPF